MRHGFQGEGTGHPVSILHLERVPEAIVMRHTDFFALGHDFALGLDAGDCKIGGREEVRGKTGGNQQEQENAEDRADVLHKAEPPTPLKLRSSVSGRTEAVGRSRTNSPTCRSLDCRSSKPLRWR